MKRIEKIKNSRIVILLLLLFCKGLHAYSQPNFALTGFATQKVAP